MQQPRCHCIKNQQQQNYSQAEKEVTERPSDAPPPEPFIANAILVQTALGNQPLVPALPFVQHFTFRDASRENDRIHRKFLDTKMSVEEVNGKDEACGEQRFIGVDNVSNVDQPSWEQPREEFREPHHQPRSSDDSHAPKHREVIEFLPVRPTVELRLLAFAKEPFVMSNEITPHPQDGGHSIRPEQDLAKSAKPKFAI